VVHLCIEKVRSVSLEIVRPCLWQNVLPHEKKPLGSVPISPLHLLHDGRRYLAEGLLQFRGVALAKQVQHFPRRAVAHRLVEACVGRLFPFSDHGRCMPAHPSGRVGALRSRNDKLRRFAREFHQCHTIKEASQPSSIKATCKKTFIWQRCRCENSCAPTRISCS